MNYKLILDVAVLAGEIMLSSGAETYRVEDTMCHILKTSECESVEAFALMTGIVATLNDESMQQPITIVKSINNRNTNLNNVIKVNAISRKYCSHELSLEDAYTELKSVKEKQYSRKMFNIATVLAVTGFVMMFGGTVADVVATAIVGGCMALCITLGKITKMNAVLADIFSCMVVAILAMVMKQVSPFVLNTNIIIVSSIMPLVPGVAITNAIRDTLQGDYLSGCARVLEAFLKAASIALGVGLGMALVRLLMGGGL